MFTMTNLKYLLALAVVFTNASSQSINPYTTVDGNLSVAERFNFTIYVEEIRGVIVHGIDSRGNQFGLHVKQGSDGVNTMRIMYNKVFKVVPLKQFCGCDPCNDTAVTFTVKLQNMILSVRCNNITVAELPSELKKSGGHDGSGENTLYAIPAAIVHQSNKIFITMGNIGPYNSGSGGTVFPIKTQQVVGCLMEFLRKDSRLTFAEGSSKFKSSCQFKCANNACKGGMCQERPSQPPICDCTSVPLNGAHCDRELKTYNRSIINTYDVRRGAKAVYLKMTWRPLLSKVYCLVNMVQRDGHVTISTNGTHVMINGSTLDAVGGDRVNVVSVNVTDGYAVVKSQNHKSRVECSSGRLVRINVGFSESADSCETFEGAYDVHFDPLLLLPRRQEEKTTPRGRIISNDIRLPGDGSSSNTTWIISTSVTVAFIALFVVVAIILYLRWRKEMEKSLQRVAGMSSASLDKGHYIMTETGVYGKIADNSDYDYIQETDVYSTIDS